jgi:hypothetical protein
MRVLRRAALTLAIVLLAAGGFAVWYVYGAWPVPQGYEFPRHSMWGGGPGGLFEGTLVETDGCIRTHDGLTVIWPPGYRLVIVGGVPVVHGSGQEIRMGEPVALGGGWYESGPLPEVAASAETSRCGGPYFLTTGLAD